VAEVAERDVRRELVAALLRRMQPLVDLLAVHSPGRQAVDRDPVPAHLAREARRPRVHARLGVDGPIGPRELAAPAAAADPGPGGARAWPGAAPGSCGVPR